MSYTERECAQRGDPEPEVRDRIKTLESAVVLAMVRKDDLATPKAATQQHPRPSGEPCRKWNSTGCTFPRCRHNHARSSYGGDHLPSGLPSKGPRSVGLDLCLLRASDSSPTTRTSDSGVWIMVSRRLI